MDPIAFNRTAWGRQVAKGNPWTVPVSAETVARARSGDWSVVLTPELAVPREWFGPLAGSRVLALASAGGQQAPVLAAAGANVTVFDLTPEQLDRDREVAGRDGLAIRTEEGDMRDLSRFADGSFDVVFHPVANLFIPDVRPVWRECFRVLRYGGRLLAGFCNPVLFLVDEDESEGGEGDLVIRHRIPYSDLAVRSPERIERMRADGDALTWGHTLDDQIGGQLAAGFVLRGFYEDGWPEQRLAAYLKPFIATLAVKP